MRPVIRFSADANCPANGIGSPSENLRAMLARKLPIYQKQRGQSKLFDFYRKLSLNAKLQLK
jgi:hypothetical protein